VANYRWEQRRVNLDRYLGRKDGTRSQSPDDPMERLLVALLAAAPTHILTLHSADMSRPETMAPWARCRKRMQRHRGKPFIHIASMVKGLDSAGGYHVHALLNEYVHLPVVHGHAHHVEFHAHLEHFASRPDLGHIAGISYVLGQTQSVFGSRHHERHRPRGHGDHRLHHPHERTLAIWAPATLSALTAPTSPAVTDRDSSTRCCRQLRRRRLPTLLGWSPLPPQSRTS